MELKRCACFNIPIGRWDVSKVKDMSFMFYEFAAFNQPLDKSANLKNQCRMFHNCKGFTYSLNDKKCEQITCHTIILSMKL
ncbi:BspA family leucine-rich repeat surface protein [Campylobacter sp.]|uniref:BspA family leucine-rich repeat surface protein n=1 Tax=Campylobacter sp. TaxID=205 RepID=UPI0039C09940